MDVLLVVLYVLFFTPVVVRLARGRARRIRRPLSAIWPTVVAKPPLVVHGAGLLLAWAGVSLALLDGRVPRQPTARGALGAAC